MRSNALKALLVFIVIFIGIIAIGALLVHGGWISPGASHRAVIALINVEGVITGSSSTGNPIYGETTAGSVAICEQLYRARDDDRVKAVLLRVNSPGGAAAASDEIYRARGLVIRTRAVAQTAEGDKNGLWTTTVAAAVFLP